MQMIEMQGKKDSYLFYVKHFRKSVASYICLFLNLGMKLKESQTQITRILVVGTLHGKKEQKAYDRKLCDNK